VIDLIEIGKAAAAVTAIVGLPVLAWKGLRALLRTVRKLSRLADEVLGDGEQRPGWGKRLTGMESLGKANAERLTGIEKWMSRVDAEMRPNGGSSMRDQINRIEEATGATRDEPQGGDHGTSS
jgi:hypothetical protein